MDYDFSALGSRNFEHLSQAVAAKLVTRRLSVFGDGPDGGREAADWAAAKSNRPRKPDFVLFITNCKLSPVPSSGKDAADAFMRGKIKELKLPISDFRIMDYDELRVALDGDRDIRERYAAFISPSDLIAEVLEKVKWEKKDFADAMNSYVARALRDDDNLNLTQAGAAGNARITMSEVFIDLPFTADSRSRTATTGMSSSAINRPDDNNASVSAALIAEVDLIRTPDSEARSDRFVLIGGPGQGKSTVTQWLAQVYRTRFLRHTSVHLGPQVAAVLASVEKRHESLGASLPGGVRWPFRVALSDLADYLAKNPEHSLIHFIAKRISVRSSVEVSTSDIRQWMRTMPTILLIDGLDEVPESSNRVDVLGSVNDFFIDVDALGADVAAVATTRPQGYSDEFSPDEYRHLRLTPLEPAQAMQYAKSIVNIRSGIGTEHGEKVVRRLQDAIQEEATLRFFETPLQVTILCILLEKVGKAPRDRSRLFSSYYEVIAQREQEKSGSLSQLLQRYESDVRDIHRAAGLLLQKRASTAGDTAATLTMDEFSELLAHQFRAQGHDDTVIDDLSSRFEQLITDRLVFLSVLRSDAIGFELRSLQEYMAAEQIVHRPEREIMPALSEIAGTPYWRNVVLFAVGGIFSDREHLRAEVVLLCRSLNTDSDESFVTLPGSELALDILLDGSADSMPKYSSPLAEVASQLVDRPTNSLLADLASLREVVVRNVIYEYANRLSPAPLMVRGNRMIVLGFLAANGHQLSNEALPQHSAKLADDELERLWPVFLEMGINPLLTSLEHRLTVAEPRAIMEGLALWDMHGADNEFPSLFMALYAISQFDLHEATFMEGVSQGIVPMSRRLEAWDKVGTAVGGGQGWESLRAAAAFVAAPTSQSLAHALRQLSSADLAEVPVAWPWVISACTEDARRSELDTDDRLLQLADLAERGEMGEAADWEAAESSMMSASVVDLALVRSLVDPANQRFPSAGSAAFEPSAPPPPLSWTLRMSIRAGGAEELADMMLGLMRVEVGLSNHHARSWVAALVMSISSMVFSRFYRAGESDAARRAAPDFLTWVMQSQPALDSESLRTFVDAAMLLPWDDKWSAFLNQQGTRYRLNVRRGEIPPELAVRGRFGNGVGLTRIVAAFDAAEFANDVVVADVITGLIDAGEVGSSLVAALQLYQRRAQPWSQELDSSIARVVSAEDKLGIDWLRAVSMYRTSDIGPLSARIAHHLVDVDPVLADEFFVFSIESPPSLAPREALESV